MHNPLPGLPLIESPLFPMLEPSLGLTAEESRIANELHQKGYAVFEFPDPELDARIDRIQHRLGPRFGVDFSDPASDKTSGEGRIQDGWRDEEDVRAIAANPQVLELLAKLYGRAAIPFQTLNFPVGTQQDAHADAVHFSSLPERFMCGLWLAMEDIHPDAGPLFYYPGSHRWPVLNNALIGRRGFGSNLASAQDPFANAWRAMSEAFGVQPETFLARKGQALIWCANLLHGGSVQHNACLTRWSQVTHYYFENCVYYTPAFSDEITGQLQVRSIRDIRSGDICPNLYMNEEFRPASAAPAVRHRRSLVSFLKRSIA